MSIFSIFWLQLSMDPSYFFRLKKKKKKEKTRTKGEINYILNLRPT